MLTKIEKVIVFKYYDGIEAALGLLPSGGGLWITSIGDSTRDFLRAFLVIDLRGNWLGRVRSLPELQQEGVFDDKRIIVLARNDSFSVDLEVACRSAADGPNFIAVGSPDFTNIRFREIDSISLKEIMSVNNWDEQFILADDFLRRAEL